MRILSFKKYSILNAGTQYVLRIFNINLWTSWHFAKIGWFRIFGKGIKYKHITQGLLFSERYGYTKFLKIGDWIIGYLK